MVASSESSPAMRYNSPQTPPDRIRDFFIRGGIPVTMTLLVISIGVFLASFFGTPAVNLFLLTHVAFWPELTRETPWTLLTYPLYAGGFLTLLIGGFFFWVAGGSLERSWGSQRYAIFFCALTLISALSLLSGWYLYQHGTIPNVNLMGFSLPLGGMIVAFCMLNAEQTIMLFLFPIRAIYVAWIVAGLTYFGAGMGPVLSLFACGGIIAAFFYVKFARSWADIGSYGGRRRTTPRGPDLRIYPASRAARRGALDGSSQRGLFDFAGRWKDWQERRRLEKLLRNSGFSDTEPGWQDDEEKRRR